MIAFTVFRLSVQYTATFGCLARCENNANMIHKVKIKCLWWYKDRRKALFLQYIRLGSRFLSRSSFKTLVQDPRSRSSFKTLVHERRSRPSSTTLALSSIKQLYQFTVTLSPKKNHRHDRSCARSNLSSHHGHRHLWRLWCPSPPAHVLRGRQCTFQASQHLHHILESLLGRHPRWVQEASLILGGNGYHVSTSGLSWIPWWPWFLGECRYFLPQAGSEAQSWPPRDRVRKCWCWCTVDGCCGEVHLWWAGVLVNSVEAIDCFCFIVEQCEEFGSVSRLKNRIGYCWWCRFRVYFSRSFESRLPKWPFSLSACVCLYLAYMLLHSFCMYQLHCLE